MSIKIKARIEDLLESFPGEWFSVARLTAELTVRYGHVNPESVQRAVNRIVMEGRLPIETRRLDLWTPGSPELEVCYPWSAWHAEGDELLDSLDDEFV